jgi:hypothetical protein
MPLEGTYINQAAMEQELEEEPPDVLDIEMAIQLMKNNKSPFIHSFILHSINLYRCGTSHLYS